MQEDAIMQEIRETREKIIAEYKAKNMTLGEYLAQHKLLQDYLASHPAKSANYQSVKSEQLVLH